MIAFEVRQELYGSAEEHHLIKVVEDPFTFTDFKTVQCVAVRRRGYTEHLYSNQVIVFDDTFAPPKRLFGTIPLYILAKHERCPKFYQDEIGITEVATGRLVMEGPIP